MPSGLQRAVRVTAPAKVNLFLAVRGARGDGYHELSTVLQAVSLADELEARLEPRGVRAAHPAAFRNMRLRLRVEAAADDVATAAVPAGPDNLVWRAAELVGRRAGMSLADPAGGADDGPVTTLRLRKRVPAAAGLAGGSADAAAALVALDRLWGLDLGRDALGDMAAELGSDVPFCLAGGTALAGGRGEALAQVLCRARLDWVVCCDAGGLATAEVYRAWDARCRPSQVQPDLVLQALATGDAETLGAALHNELEPAAFALRPDLAERKQQLLDAGAVGAVLSGSGPTLLALAGDAAHAVELRDRLDGAFAAVHLASSPAGRPEADEVPGGVE